MKGDFTRVTFDKRKHFSRVLKQQGRVELDADFNEAMAIMLHRQQALAADLVGPHGAPPTVGQMEDEGFKITQVSATDFKIGKGHYYVDGVLCENEGIKDANGNFGDLPYTKQPDYPQPKDLRLPTPPFLAYLDAWERHISYLEDAAIREVGLGVHAPDTATRAKVVWQVKVEPNISACPDADTWKRLKEGWQPKNRGLLKAATVQSKSTDLESHCIIPPEARYRGAENQLYRVEIHKSGKANDGEHSATFKWSRDNGSIIFPVKNFAGETITLESLGRDTHSGLEPGQWVELVDDDLALIGLREQEINPLGKIREVDVDQMTVTVDWSTTKGLPTYEANDYELKHVLLRRWDHTDNVSVPGAPFFDSDTGTLRVETSTDASKDKWLTLENGIQISFAPPTTGNAHYYRSGDYWLIPARTATGDVEWPGPVDDPEAIPPHGVEHHYAPLSIIPASGNPLDCRHKVTSVIGPETDLQVHNLEVGGDLKVAGTINGRDVSADAAAFAAHVARTDNPHATTAAQVGALPAAGGTISGDLSINAGTALFGNAGDANLGLGAVPGKRQSVFITGTPTPSVSTSISTAVMIWPIVQNMSGLHIVAAVGPVDTLSVAGTARFTGTKIGYVADTFINGSGRVLRTGDVVKLKSSGTIRFYGDNNSIPIPEVILADKENDPLVIGIVAHEATPASDEPDLRMEPEDPTSIPDGGELFVVTLGTFAHCQADASGSPIEVGDLLTSSSKPGHARKATEPKIGAIIGKALEPLAQGTGYIAVFVNIQ